MDSLYIFLRSAAASVCCGYRPQLGLTCTYVLILRLVSVFTPRIAGAYVSWGLWLDLCWLGSVLRVGFLGPVLAGSVLRVGFLGSVLSWFCVKSTLSTGSNS